MDDLRDIKRQFGDFQTPTELARVVWDNVDLTGVDLVVEPTIGLANFAKAASAGARSLPWAAWDINPRYAEAAQAVLSNSGICGKVEVKNVFDLKSADLGNRIDGKTVLVIGNPPWVTSAGQGGSGSPNLPRKWNRFGLRGLDAITGKANFDIAEAVLLSVAAALKNAHQIRFALLVKRSVAMKVARDFLGSAGVDRVRFTRIDAKRWFDVSVEAGLLELSITKDRASSVSIELRDEFGDEVSTMAGVASNGAFVENLDTYEAARAVEAIGGDNFDWRQGLKHDLTKVLELRQGSDGFVNGFDEVVDVEPDIISPLYKSSDLASGGTPRRWIPLYQHDLSGPLPDLSFRWPKLAHYLESHAELFAARRSSIYRGKHRFMLFGVGPYTVAPYKVALSGFYKQPEFRVIGPGPNGAPPVVDDTCYLLPFEDLGSAQSAAEYLNSEEVQAFLASVADLRAKRPYTKALLSRIRLPREVDRRALALF